MKPLYTALSVLGLIGIVAIAWMSHKEGFMRGHSLGYHKGVIQGMNLMKKAMPPHRIIQYDQNIKDAEERDRRSRGSNLLEDKKP